MRYKEFNGMNISQLGLGCSRLGSVAGATTKESELLISEALDLGITFFDTASSYGQGDSEKILGRKIRNIDNIFLVTKIGKRVPLKAKLLQPFKGAIRQLSRSSLSTQKRIKHARKGTLPVCFELPYLTQELDKSRKRLGMDCIPLVMLHSPSLEDLIKGDAVGFLEQSKSAGALRAVGVSVDDIHTANQALKDSRIEVIQVPFIEGDVEFVHWAKKAKKIGKFVVAREIFTGIQSALDKPEHIKRNLNRVLEFNPIDTSLIGTTNKDHLSEIIKLSS